ATTSKTFQVDTEVTPLTSATQPGGVDGVVSEAEASQGFVLNGQVEQGSTVIVTIAGQALTATVSASGAWSVNVPESVIPQVDGESVSIDIAATDAAGNTRSITETMVVDTVAPDAPDMTELRTNENQGFPGLALATTGNDIAIDQVSSSGGTSSPQSVRFDDFDITTRGVTDYDFDQAVPDGSHLVITATDGAGNSSSTYVVLNDPNTNQSNVTLARNIGGKEIDTIDLEFTEEATLTITEAQIVALTGEDNTVKVLGNEDDSVRITGARSTGEVRVDGQVFQSFELGDATIFLDEGIGEGSNSSVII
ncbi:MAG TPA: RTX toxin, partial [Marivita sp.]|nr:RTX toxin [Marivita sp.]